MASVYQKFEDTLWQLVRRYALARYPFAPVADTSTNDEMIRKLTDSFLSEHFDEVGTTTLQRDLYEGWYGAGDPLEVEFDTREASIARAGGLQIKRIRLWDIVAERKG